MKTDRLIGIIIELQQKKQVTAPYLAEKFEVSRRTISRDIEDICCAGIPIVTTQGAGGGISIMPGFNLDTTVFTKDELTAIFIGLKSLDSISNENRAERLAQKIGVNESIAVADNMVIDLSSFYKDQLSEKIEIFNRAINERHKVKFHYYYSKGESDRSIEPYLIIFKWSDWYVFGWCSTRQDFRMFKLRRLWKLYICQEAYIPREIPEEKKKLGSNMTDDYFITAIYDSSMKYKLVEEYGPNSFSVMEDGRLYARWGFTDEDTAAAHFLDLGDKVEVIDPPEMREKLKKAAQSILKKYT